MIYILLTIFFALLTYYLLFLKKIWNGLQSFDKTGNVSGPVDEFVSVIIPFRNEEDNILASLKSIEAQTYPKDKFEVIYVNDASTDSSLELITNQAMSSNIQVVNKPEDNSERAHKKYAVKYGIDNARGEIIVTTDADCIHDPDWLTTLLSTFNEDTGLVSGPVDFKEEKTLFKQLQRTEFASLIITGAGLIGAGTPSLCNGANLAYRKKAYELAGGFEDISHITSGEDEMLMQKIAYDTNYDVKFCADRNAAAVTYAQATVSDFIQQRKRWASKGLHYLNKNLVLRLSFIFFFYFGLIAQIPLGIFADRIFIMSFVISLLAKGIIEYNIMYKGASLLYDKSILRNFVLAELLHIPYIVFSAILGLFGNYTWKGRKIKR